MLIAIDGYEADETANLGAKIALDYGYVHVDIDQMYRAVALLALRYPNASLPILARRVRLSSLQDENLNRDDLGVFADRVEANVLTNKALHSVLRQFASEVPNMVVTGYDIGGRVFPNADLKVVLQGVPMDRGRPLPAGAGGARYIDSTKMTPHEVFERMVYLVDRTRKNLAKVTPAPENDFHP
jgi:cytidylate kinase